jgi:hypothetical protein
MNNPTDFFPITFEYKSRDAKEALPDVIAHLCPEEIKSTLNALIIPPLPEQEAIEVEGKLWKFDTWDPAQNEVTEEGIHFTRYWYPAKDISVTKLWDDADNQDGLRPETIKVSLLAQTTEMKDAVVVATHVECIALIQREIS